MPTFYDRRFPRGVRYGVASRRISAERPGNQPRRLDWRLRPAQTASPPEPGVRSPLLARLEAVLMMADEPLTARQLAEILHLPDEAAAHAAVQSLRDCLDADAAAFQVEPLAGGYQLLTRPEYHRWLTLLRRSGRHVHLSPSAWETLAVIAYRQPITRAEIEKIRQVNVTESLHQLIDKGLVRVVGRQESLGRPALYGTTRKFLEILGLNTLADLPQVEPLPFPALSPRSGSE